MEIKEGLISLDQRKELKDLATIFWYKMFTTNKLKLDQKKI